MLTRIVIDGFKTFKDFDLEIPPFLVILGRNASGKSNLFDAIQFLRSTADGTLMEAVQASRGDLHELLHHDVAGNEQRDISFTVEVLLDGRVKDDFGDEDDIRHSRLRYDLRLELREVPTKGGGPVAEEDKRERLYVASETVTLIRQPADEWVTSRGATAKERKNLAKYSSRSSDLLLETTTDENNRRVFAIRQEGRAGKPRLLPATDAVATVLTSITNAQDYPLLYALKKELMSWGLLHLDPAALRRVNSYDDDDVLSPAGDNLANALRRISLETATEDRPAGELADIAGDLARIIPEVMRLEFSEDRERRQRQVLVVTRDDAPYTARVASDGTLRALALLTALHDPSVKGLICFEEPENGIYPQRLVYLIQHLSQLVRENFRRRLSDATKPAFQLILSSHSPVILRALPESNSLDEAIRDDVVFIDTIARRSGDSKSRVTRARRVRTSAQIPLPIELRGRVVSTSEVEAFQVFDTLESG